MKRLAGIGLAALAALAAGLGIALAPAPALAQATCSPMSALVTRPTSHLGMNSQVPRRPTTCEW